MKGINLASGPPLARFRINPSRLPARPPRGSCAGHWRRDDRQRRASPDGITARIAHGEITLQGALT